MHRVAHFHTVMTNDPLRAQATTTLVIGWIVQIGGLLTAYTGESYVVTGPDGLGWALVGGGVLAWMLGSCMKLLAEVIKRVT